MEKNFLILTFGILVLIIFLVFLLFIYQHTNNKDNNSDLDKNSIHPHMYSVVLSDAEKKFLIKYLKRSENYLEFGSGGSTFLALLNSKANIISVESDENWLNHMREWNLISENEGKRLIFHLINIGPTEDWGYPTDYRNYRHLFPDYSSNVFKIYNNHYDLIFIDGRFRVACALQAILNSDKNTKIIIHDFTSRPYYHTILKFLDVESVVDTMVLLKLKQNIEINAVKNMYDLYKYDTR